MTEEVFSQYQSIDPIREVDVPASDSPKARALKEEILMIKTERPATEVPINEIQAKQSDSKPRQRRRVRWLAPVAAAAALVAATFGLQTLGANQASALETAVTNTTASLNSGRVQQTIEVGGQTSVGDLVFDGDSWSFEAGVEGVEGAGFEATHINGQTYVYDGFENSWMVADAEWTLDEFGRPSPSAEIVETQVGRALAALTDFEPCEDDAESYCGSTDDDALLDDLLILDLGEPGVDVVKSADVRIDLQNEMVSQVTVEAIVDADGEQITSTVVETFDQLGQPQSIDLPAGVDDRANGGS